MMQNRHYASGVPNFVISAIVIPCFIIEDPVFVLAFKALHEAAGLLKGAGVLQRLPEQVLLDCKVYLWLPWSPLVGFQCVP